MAQLIDKSAVVAEIERRIKENKVEIERAIHKHLEEYFEGYEDSLVLFKEKYLDTLEVKDIELEQETQRILDEHFFYPEEDDELKEIPKLARYIAKHFFELGLKAQKGE